MLKIQSLHPLILVRRLQLIPNFILTSNAVEVYNKLKTLDKNKATGIHNIPNKILLLCADIVAPHLADIFNYPSVSDFKCLGSFSQSHPAPVLC